MNEGILIEFERDGQLAPVTSFRSTQPSRHENGIVLDGETSQFPRGFALNLRPLDEVTKLAYKRVQRNHDWLSRNIFELEAARQGGQLRLEGVDDDALPAGRYEIKMRLSGMRFAQATQDIRIRKDESKVVRFREKPAKQKLLLNRPIDAFDEESVRILRHRKSQLDGRSAEDWLQNSQRQDRRKAPLLNILAKLAALPRVANPLNRHVHYVFHAEMDRIYAAVSEDFHKSVKRTFSKDPTIHSTHERLLLRIPHRRAPDYKLTSYREKAASSVQAVIAEPPADVADRTQYVDLDIDEANPGWDLARFILHVGDVLDPRKTNHLELRKTLTGGATSDFLYYDVVKT